MKEISIVFCDEDAVYLKALIQAFQRSNALQVNYIVLTDSNKLKNYIKDPNIALFIMAQTAYEQIFLDYIKSQEGEEKEEWKKKIMILSETTAVVYSDIQTIFKYQAVSSIIEPVKQWFLTNYKDEFTKRKEAKLIAIMELVGNGLGAVLGQAVAQICSEYEHVLVVNMELFPYVYGTMSTEYNLSDYIYAITTKSDSTSQIVSNMVCYNGSLENVAPIISFKDLYELEEGFTSSFLSSLNQDTDYDAIVLILDFLQPHTLKLLCSCDTIISLEPTNYVENRKRDQFYEMLKYEECEWIRERIHYSQIDPDYLLHNVMENGQLTEELRMIMSPWVAEVTN